MAFLCYHVGCINERDVEEEKECATWFGGGERFPLMIVVAWEIGMSTCQLVSQSILFSMVWACTTLLCWRTSRSKGIGCTVKTSLVADDVWLIICWMLDGMFFHFFFMCSDCCTFSNFSLLILAESWLMLEAKWLMESVGSTRSACLCFLVLVLLLLLGWGWWVRF